MIYIIKAIKVVEGGRYYDKIFEVIKHFNSINECDQVIPKIYNYITKDGFILHDSLGCYDQLVDVSFYKEIEISIDEYKWKIRDDKLNKILK